mmetsp:Transcript_10342/g.14247  ORF Transcript_10342/g.14247 Transcript_10342/m.14247 type:complete len:158 (+) Transcript_10342:46-519(+)
MESSLVFPNIKWAQRKENVFIIVEVQDYENHQIDLSDDHKLSFSADSHGQKYGFNVELFAAVDKEASRWNTKGRNVIFNLKKKEAESWSRITKEKVKNARINIDWGKWVDSDDEGEEGDKGMNQDLDPSMMQNFGGANGGMGGMGGMANMFGGANGG